MQKSILDKKILTNLIGLVVIFAIGSHVAIAATTNLLYPNGSGTYAGFIGAGG